MLFTTKNKCKDSTPDFIFDEACLDVLNTLNETVQITGQYRECDGCDFQNITSLQPNQNVSILINTRFSLNMKGANCSWSSELLEHYRYGWNITAKCPGIYIKESADNPYIPILSAFIILFLFGTIWYMIKCIYKCTKNNAIWQRYPIFANNSENENLSQSLNDSAPLVVERPPKPLKHPNRIKSIDTFRGICIVIMIFVNYGGGKYWFFSHSPWNGLTVADLVFPWFIWLMGMSYTISLSTKLRNAVPRRQLVIEVLRRSAMLVLLGLILNSHGEVTEIGKLRFPGVLQHIGVTYLVVGLIESVFAKRLQTNEGAGRFNLIQDLCVSLPQWGIIACFVIIHTCITFLVNVPGCGKGYLGPGGLHDHAKHELCTGGVAGYIDREIFGNHMYQKPTCTFVYQTTQAFDPEGFLSTFTSIFLAYMGIHAGRIFSMYASPLQRTVRFLIWGVVTALIGGILCNFSKNGGAIPINKNLWSLSFVLVLGGMAFIIQAFLYVLVDLQRKWGGRPFFYPGMNPIFLYVGHVIFKNTFPFAWIPNVKSHSAYLGMNLWGTALWVAISIFLYKRNIFFKI
ncbi:heparan-alpha-glucosaminide N-acetyltransferase-like [Onthophagus taurus]|uniref:heparan-alpha-glucosaminide N-acetyltransferase-like n=1 Tax=Onthophagus taurus TaxID=166361 RepID=UPI000C2054E2|nr:heparan-alpha-glucosaminide N-acetyltransferase-like [Onthophagus taurus]